MALSSYLIINSITFYNVIIHFLGEKVNLILVLNQIQNADKVVFHLPEMESRRQID